MSRSHAIAGAVLALTAAQSAHAAALDLYYERALMGAADARCGLFTPQIGAALAAAEAQARGAALRSGAPGSSLRATAASAAAKAAATSCVSPDLKLAAARVRQAFQDYGRLQRMDFPGELAGWKADRTLPVRTPVWRLVQTASLGGQPLSFGLAGRWGAPQALIAVTSVAGGDTPYAARLVMRDLARSSEPYLNQVRAGSSAKLPLWARTPPRWASVVFAAEARSPADPSLAPPGAGSAMAFRFPASAAQAIAALDPREAITVELLYPAPTGDVVRKAYVEVGDFAAGQAFLAAAAR